MQIILFLLLIFTIGCVMYGISAGVQGIQRGASGFAHYCDPKNKSQKIKSITETHTESKNQILTQCCLNILEQLRELHQQGGLSQEDFNDLHKLLISSFSSVTHPIK